MVTQKRRQLFFLLVLLVLAIAVIPAKAQEEFSADQFSSDLARDWSALHLSLVRRTWGFSPPVAARAFGYLGITLYESVVPGVPDHQSLAGQLNELAELPQPIDGAGYHWPSAANSALASMTRLLFPTAHAAHKAAIEDLYAQYAAEFQLATDFDTFTRSVEFGQQIADAIYAWSQTDGGHEGFRRNFPTDFEYPVGEGMWQPTERNKGNPQRPMQPRWGENRPFVLATGAECAPPPPPAYSESPESDFYAEAFEVYTVTSQLTAEQLEIARFWADDPYRTATPAGHSIAILAQVLEAENASLATAAEAYARIGIGLADAFISCWNAKYQYNMIRPVTYIQQVIDPLWVSPLTTPPFPEYPSGHSVESSATAAILSGMFGEAYTFSDTTHAEWGLPSRSFDSFSSFAQEAALSRIYGGIHFRSAVENGLEQGACIAQRVNSLQFHA
jgi:hypothetical protein